MQASGADGPGVRQAVIIPFPNDLTGQRVSVSNLRGTDLGIEVNNRRYATAF